MSLNVTGNLDIGIGKVGLMKYGARNVRRDDTRETSHATHGKCLGSPFR